MNGIVACTMSIPTTDISCIIRIFVKKPQKSLPYPWWEIIGGSLFDIFPYGKMGEWKLIDGNLKIIGIIPGFAIPYVPVGPVIEFDAPEPFTVAELNRVPDNFLDAVTPLRQTYTNLNIGRFAVDFLLQRVPQEGLGFRWF